MEPSLSPEDVDALFALADLGVRAGLDGRPAPAVVLRMPPYVARHLACVLDDWSTIGRLLESARGGDERDLAGVLYEAARVADSLRAGAS